MTATEISIIVSYVLFLSIFLFFTPILAPNIISVTQEELQQINQPVEAGIFEIVIGFINGLIVRFSLLISISTTNLFIGIIIGAYSAGALVALIKIIAEALP